MKPLAYMTTVVLLSSLCACTPHMSKNAVPATNNTTPKSAVLLKKKFYYEQIVTLDNERKEKSLKELEELIKQGRVTTKYNGTKPIIVTKEPSQDDDPSELSIHEGEKRSILEYYIKTDKQIVEEEKESEKEVPPSGNSSKAEKEDLHEAPKKEVVESKNEPIETLDKEHIDLPENTIKEDSDKKETVFTAAWDKMPFGSEYTNYVLNALEVYGKDLLSNSFKVDDDGYCKKYNKQEKEERKQFWLTMISWISRWEAGAKFNTYKSYEEKFGNREMSRGLLQLGLTSTKQRAYSCGFTYEQEINEDPEKSLICGVKILNHWIKKDRVMRAHTYDDNGNNKWLGIARYWSVLRIEYWERKNSEKAENLKTIKENTSKLSVCN